MDPAVLLAFLAVDLALVLTPGADWAYALAAGLARRSPLPAVAGLAAGYLLHTLLVAAGLAAVVAASDRLLTALTTAGACYLVGLGALTVRSGRRRHEVPEPTATVTTPVGDVLRGVGVSGLNPKGLLLFLALLPQFVEPGAAWPPAAQAATLGLSHVVLCAGVYLAVAVLAGRLLRARPAAARLVTLASGLVMLALGVGLLAGRPPWT